MKIGISTGLSKIINNGPIGRRKDVRYVEISVPFLNLIKDNNIDEEKLNEIKEKIETFNLKCTLHAPYSNSRMGLNLSEENLNGIGEKTIEIAREIETELIVIHPGEVIKNYDRSLLNVCKNVLELKRLAEEIGCKISLETMHVCKNHRYVGVIPKELLDIVRLSDENIGITFDFGHSFLSSRYFGYDHLEYYEILKRYINHIHIHDNNGIVDMYEEQRGDEHLPIGQGRIDFKNFKIKNNLIWILESNSNENGKSIDLMKKIFS